MSLYKIAYIHGLILKTNVIAFCVSVNSARIEIFVR